MKKLYILGFASLLSTAIIAQQTKRLNRSNKQETETVSTAKKFNSLSTKRASSRSAQSLIWSDDFSTPANWTMANASTPARDWEIVNTIPANLVTAGFDPTFASTSGGNFALYNSDAQGSATAIDDATITTVSSINLTGYGNVMLTFNELYAKFADVTTVQISNDGTTWTDFEVNASYAANQASANPELVTVDISSVATNQPTVWVRFNFNGAYDYAWMIDDVEINASVQTPADIQAIEAYIPTGCSQGNESVLFVLKNNGTAPATGFDVRYIVNGGTPVVETYTGTVAPGDTILYTFIAPLNMTTAAVYNLTAVGTISSDGNINNDSAFYVGQTIAPVSIPYTTGFETAPASDLLGWTVADVDGGGYSFTVSPTAHSGSQSLWAFENNVDGVSNDWAFSSCTDFTAATFYRVTYWKRLTTGYEGSLGISLGSMPSVAGMTQTISPLTPLTGNSTWVKDSADFTVPTTGTYYLGLNAANANATATLSIRIDDLNIKVVTSPVGVNELASATVAVYPNPSTGAFTIDLGSNAKASVEVYNVVGSKVIAKELSTQSSTLDMTGFNAGIYFIKVSANNSVVTKKVTITK